MNVTQHGEGPLQILLVPGGPGLLPGFYDELVEGLTAFGRVRTFLQRGTVPADSDEFPRSMEEFADELAGVLEEIGGDADATVLLGHSFGAAVAVEALLGGADVDRAVLSNGFDSGDMLRRGLGDRRQELPAEFQEGYAHADRSNLAELMPLLATHFYPRHFCRRDPWPESFVTGLGQVNPRILLHFIGSDLFDPDGVLSDWDRSADLGAVTVPSLVVSGTYDYYRLSDSRRIAEALPEGELWVSETASHSPWIEDADGFYGAVERFLAKY